MLTFADFYSISVKQSTIKPDIKTLLYVKLVKQQILFEITKAGVASQMVPRIWLQWRLGANQRTQHINLMVVGLLLVQPVLA